MHKNIRCAKKSDPLSKDKPFGAYVSAPPGCAVFVIDTLEAAVLLRRNGKYSITTRCAIANAALQ
jgi:hypothetical protein